MTVQEGSFLDGVLDCCLSGTPVDECGICNGDGSSCTGFLEIHFTFNRSLMMSESYTFPQDAQEALQDDLESYGLDGYPASNLNITAWVDYWRPDIIKVLHVYLVACLDPALLGNVACDRVTVMPAVIAKLNAAMRGDCASHPCGLQVQLQFLPSPGNITYSVVQRARWRLLFSSLPLPQPLLRGIPANDYYYYSSYDSYYYYSYYDNRYTLDYCGDGICTARESSWGSCYQDCSQLDGCNIGGTYRTRARFQTRTVPRPYAIEWTPSNKTLTWQDYNNAWNSHYDWSNYRRYTVRLVCRSAAVQVVAFVFELLQQPGSVAVSHRGVWRSH